MPSAPNGRDASVEIGSRRLMTEGTFAMAIRSDALTAPALRAIATAEGYPLGDPATSLGEAVSEGHERRAGLIVSLLAAGALALIAASTDGPTAQRLLSGGAIGAGFGIFGTALTGGCIPCGAVVGLVAGTGVGHFYDTHEHLRPPSVAVWRMPV